MLTQRALWDSSRAVTEPHAPPDHAWGMRFPGVDTRVWTQTTLGHAWRTPSPPPASPASPPPASPPPKKAVRAPKRRPPTELVA